MAMLFECSWINSFGEKDGWGFELNEDMIRWSYRALFDAHTGESSNGSLSFRYEDFKRLLEAFLRQGRACLKIEDGCVTFAQGDSDICVRVDYFCYSVTDSIPEIPPRVFELFGIAKI